MEANLTLNTCFIGIQAIGESIRNIALYSHLIPIFFSLLLGGLVFFKARREILTKIFFTFTIAFSFWLVGDLITWTSNNYYLIYASWSLLAYIEILFYVLALYFVIIFVRKSDIPQFAKILLFATTLIPYGITILQKSVTGFNYPVCEAFNSSFLDQYKLYLEILIVIVIFIYSIIPFFKRDKNLDKKSHIIVISSILLFLCVFGVTEYLAALTGNYELNLYALFVIPVFLIAITYSIFRLDIFNLKILSTYFFVVGFMILAASQLLFISSSTDKWLSLVTLTLSISISFMMFKNLKRESDQRVQIEKLNTDLQSVIQQRESLMHLINHKVKGSFTHSKYIFAALIDGMFGVITPEIKKAAQMGLDSDNLGVKTIDLILNAANLQNGTIQYDMKPASFKDVLLKTIEDKKETIEKKGLKLEVNIKEDDFTMNGDIFWLREVTNNLIDNALYYTKAGSITVGLERKGSKILFSVKDTGIGISEDDKKILFKEGGRGKESVKTNVNSTGYGLYSVKLIVGSHGGRAWAESEGKDKGSSFFVELNAL
jgi:signal transduction histidine kinase